MSASEREQLSTLVALVRYTSALGTQSECINRSEHVNKCVCFVMNVCYFIIALDLLNIPAGGLCLILLLVREVIHILEIHLLLI